MKFFKTNGLNMAKRLSLHYRDNYIMNMEPDGVKNNFDIVSALRRQLSWTHLKSIIYIEDPLKREFFIEMSKMEKWSTRTLENRMNSMLYERTAISRNPDKKILGAKLHKSIEHVKNRFIQNQESNYGKED